MIEKLQEIEDRKKRLFREQSDDIDGTFRENTGYRSNGHERKRARSNEDDGAKDGSMAYEARKRIRRPDGEGLPIRTGGMAGNTRRRSYNEDEIMFDDRPEDNTEERVLSNSGQRRSSFALPPIGLSPGSMISEHSDLESDADMDEPLEMPLKRYSPFVQQRMYKRPEMSELVNIIPRRKTASDMWEQSKRVNVSQQDYME